ncbi:MAG: hypothetical protein ACR2FU_02495 [Streptosporangiaceae bacterium]
MSQASVQGARGSETARRAGPTGNERLTAMTGAVLLVLFGAEVVTTLLMGSLFGLHFSLGMVLIGPVCVKIGSTVWRFCRYYLGAKPYVRRGPPPMTQRVLGPALVLTSAGVLGTGVLLAVGGPTLTWEKPHQLFFYLWVIVVVVHLVHYLPKLPGILARRPAERVMHAVARSRARWLLLAGSLVGGLVLAILTYHLRARWGGWGGSIL